MQTVKTDELRYADSKTIASEAVKILLEKKGLDVRMFDVREKSSVTDFYVNATGRSSTQVGALADDVVFLLGNRGREALRVEGRLGNAWLLVDYGDVIVNVFDKPSRDFYDLDKHLPVGSEVDISDLLREVDEKFDLTRK
ncbi:MAG: ribosome silencing factor [Clostridia bacterium]|nr:ribosome silencing factor [Clostridia bacterium]